MTSHAPGADLLRLLVEGSALIGVPVSPETCGKLIRHVGLLLEWNNRVNLTSLRDPREVCVLHVIDSLTVFKVLGEVERLRVLDIGTGGGFPGMVMKIACKDLHVTLMDKNPKKIVFLKEVAKDLGLSDISFIGKDLDTLFGNFDLHAFDVIVSRAVRWSHRFVDAVRVMLCPGGSLVRMTGPSHKLEFEPPRGFVLAETWSGTLPFSTRTRAVSRLVRVQG